MHEIGEYKVECLSEHEAEFKKALARESGVQGGLLDEKKKSKVENLVTLSQFMLLKTKSVAR
jgi:hypothetical protein